MRCERDRAINEAEARTKVGAKRHQLRAVGVWGTAAED